MTPDQMIRAIALLAATLQPYPGSLPLEARVDNYSSYIRNGHK